MSSPSAPPAAKSGRGMKIAAITTVIGVAVAAAVVLPMLKQQQLESKRSELRLNMQSIARMLQEQELPARIQEPYPRAITALDGELAGWSRSESGSFAELGWSPDGDSRGTYAFEILDNRGWVLHGWADLDEDGTPCHLVMTEGDLGTLKGRWLPDAGVEIRETDIGSLPGLSVGPRVARVWVSEAGVY